MVWRVGRPAYAFTQAIGTQADADGKLDGLLTNAAIGTLGGHDLSSLVSTNPSDLQVDQIEAEYCHRPRRCIAQLRRHHRRQIRLERIALPQENVSAVFDQMRAERRQFAAKFEAEGELEASRIRSQAQLGSGPHQSQGRRRNGAHPRRIGGTGGEDVRRRATGRSGAVQIHALSRVAR